MRRLARSRRSSLLIARRAARRSRRPRPTSSPPRRPAPGATIAADDLLVIDLKNGGAGRDPARAGIRAGPRRQHPRARAAAASGTAPRSIGSRTIMSRNGAITRATSRLPAGVVAKPPAEYHRGRCKGLAVAPLGSPDAYAPARRLRARLAGRLRSQGGQRPTSPIATAASASAATCRPTPARAASFTRSSAMRRATSTATSRSSAG